MNLVRDPWLPFRKVTGEVVYLPVSVIGDPDIVDLALPRADFQGAAYQFLIGLLQTTFAPRDKFDWEDLYLSPPSQETLQEAFSKVLHAFNLIGDGPLFMQDYESLEGREEVPIKGLLIDAPGEKTIKDNTDHFVKRDVCQAMSLESVAIALFTLQINAPSGGQGHRVGLRGGGPLTSLVIPQERDASLWQKLWFNVLDREYFPYSEPDLHSPQLFPWLGETKISQEKGTVIYQHEVHALTVYWAMPRRIRLCANQNEGLCSITGKQVGTSVTHYRTQNFGNNYEGTWSHPLTPYSWSPKKPEADHLSLKAQPGGIQYKHWAALNLSGTRNDVGLLPAKVIAAYKERCQTKVLRDVTEQPRLWVFGYDLDNMKARCWYSSLMPLFHIEPDLQDEVLEAIEECQTLAENSLWQARSQFKAAWFEKPGDAKGDVSFFDLAFWQQTEAQFYSTVQQVVDNLAEDRFALNPEQSHGWLKAVQKVSLDLFDEFALSELGGERSMAKRITARRNLTGWLYGSKKVKEFKEVYKIVPAKEEGK